MGSQVPACPPVHPPVHHQRDASLALLTGVVGVFVLLGARPAVVLLDVALPALAAVAPQGVDADVRAQRLIARGALVDIWV